MKILELELTKQLKSRRYVSWQDIFHDHGWRFLGQGIEATVGRHPQKPYVVKVFDRDTAYPDFVQLVQQHQNNPHFPQFSRYVRPVPGTAFSYVRMEILTPIDDNTILEVPYLSQMAYLYVASVSQGLEFHQSWSAQVGMRLRHMVKGNVFDPTTQQTLWKDIGEPESSWKKAVDLVLGRYSKGTKWPSRLDMHPGNFMLRGTTLVITDPFVSRRF
jgi:hypothetical protein